MSDFLESDQAILVLWSSVRLYSPVSADAKPSIVSVSKWGTFNSGVENIILVISGSEEFEHFRVFVITDSF